MTSDGPEGRATRHTAHDDVSVELRSWFTTSVPELGYVATEQWYGTLSESGSVMGTRLILTVDDPREVAAALGEARRRVGGPITVWVDDRTRHVRLDRALRLAGCAPAKATVHLALVGAFAARPGPRSLTAHDVGVDELEEWAVTKLQSFGDTELQPTGEQLARELAVRTPELALAKLQLARLDGVAVSILGYYGGPDQLVFNLGTRVPYRHRGIAQELLSRWVQAGRAEGCRSLMINADHGGAPEALYRAMGFVDEIYWYQRYELA